MACLLFQNVPMSPRPPELQVMFPGHLQGGVTGCHDISYYVTPLGHVRLLNN